MCQVLGFINHLCPQEDGEPESQVLCKGMNKPKEVLQKTGSLRGQKLESFLWSGVARGHSFVGESGFLYVNVGKQKERKFCMRAEHRCRGQKVEGVWRA